jgi:hypothetical protein
MNLTGNRSRLTGLTRDLSLQWDETKSFWLDAKSQEFEQRFMIELEAQTSRAVGVLEQLDKLLQKVRSDCE